MVSSTAVRWTVAFSSVGLLLCQPESVIHAQGLSPQRSHSPCAVHYPSDERVEWECRRLSKGETLEHLFGEHWVDVARFNRIDRRHAHAGAALKIPKRVEDIADFSPLPVEFPPAEREEQFILIDLSEQFLGAYEYGGLRFSMPIASGEGENATPNGEFRITAAHRHHSSCLYTIENTDMPYPMNYALRFHINRAGVSYWIHGRDLPGEPASHGCIGLYDEAMQKEIYGTPKSPELEDAKRLYEWVIGDRSDDGSVLPIKNGPRLVVQGKAPGP